MKKLTPKQKKILIVVAIAVVIFLLWKIRGTKKVTAPEDYSGDDGGTFDYGTYNAPHVGGSNYDFGDIINSSPLDLDGLAAKICACNNKCGLSSGSIGSDSYAFLTPFNQIYRAPQTSYNPQPVYTSTAGYTSIINVADSSPSGEYQYWGGAPSLSGWI
jgi:hypothetical protein